MFLNCTAHTLTDEQKFKAGEYSNEIADLKELDGMLHTSLVNCPADEERTLDLVLELIQLLIGLEKKNKDLVVHLPIGSPYFMAVFFRKFPEESRIRFVFSHSDRVSVDEKQPDGSVVKKGVFKFVKFLVLEKK